mmetsp:Transcript_15062/g.22164  ORF Transcript_15062/g.22164 Transcript_15062/m.22164 type:complete len:384 (-) Transcript_15062:261-1412(-)
MSSTADSNLEESPPARRFRSVSSVSSDSLSSVASKSKNQKCLKKSSSLPAETVDYLKGWMMSPEHVAHPYPTEQEKAQIMVDTGIELKQLTNWFVNNRKRYWKPRVEARLQQQAQSQVAAVVATTNISHIVSPAGGDRPTFTVSQQAVGASYIALDMTKPLAARPSQSPGNENRPTIIPSESMSSFIPAPSARAVSDESQSDSDENASLADSQGSMENEVNDEIDNATGTITRRESVDIHVLSPLSGDVPTIEDVTILPHVQAARILKSYHNCVMTYSFQKMSEERKKIQSYRDEEVARIKKHYLKLFFEEKSVTPLFQSDRIVSPQKRKRENSNQEIVTLRPKFARKNAPSTWRGACIRAGHFRDASLPSLEEAARLFGYSQ